MRGAALEKGGPKPPSVHASDAAMHPVILAFRRARWTHCRMSAKPESTQHVFSWQNDDVPVSPLLQRVCSDGHRLV